MNRIIDGTIKTQGGYKINCDRKITKFIKMNNEFQYFQLDNGQFTIASLNDYFTPSSKSEYISSGEIKGVLYLMTVSGKTIIVSKISKVIPTVVQTLDLPSEVKPIYMANYATVSDGFVGAAYHSKDRTISYCTLIYLKSGELSAHFSHFVYKSQPQITDSFPSVVTHDGIDTVLTMKSGELVRD